MKKTLSLLLLLLLLLVLSCGDNLSKEEDKYLNNAINQVSINENYEWIVILPGIGCHGCIQEGEYFMKNHINNEKILFVLTKTSSFKILQQKIDVNLKEHQNIFIDKDQLFYIPTQNNIYPCVVYLKNGEIINHSFQSPQTSALYDLEKML